MGLSSSEPAMSRYLHEKAIRLRVPVSGNFELTPRCNFSCEMCYVHEEPQEAELTAEQWLKLAGDAKEQGLLFLLLTGGEPLLREDFAEIYTELYRLGLVLSINSNGSLVKDYMKLFKKYPPFRMNISLYGKDNETYKRQCKNPSFDKVLGAIEALKEAKIPVKINSVFTKNNCEDYKEIIDLAKGLGVQIKTTAYNYPTIRLCDSTGENRARLSAEQAGRLIADCDYYRFNRESFLHRARTILDGSVKESVLCAEGKGVMCRAGRGSFWLAWNGIMRPCGMMTAPESYPLKAGFATAWEEIVNKTSQIRLPLECSACEKKEVCSVCAAMCYAETGKFDKRPQYICDMVDAIIKETAVNLQEAENAN